jgi:hypothetical protein
MAWSDFSRGEKYQRLGYLLVFFGFAAFPIQNGSIWFSDIASQKGEIIAEAQRQLKEICIQEAVSSKVRLECGRFEDLLDVASEAQFNGRQPLPRLRSAHERAFIQFEAAYDLRRADNWRSMHSREYFYVRICFLFVLGSIGGFFLHLYGSQLRRSTNAQPSF